MAVKGRTGSAGDNFVKMVAGALVGAAFGYLLGKSIFIQWEGTKVAMDIPGTALGSILGITVIRLFTGGRKEVAPAAADPKADKAKAEKKK
jgi:F0F1-type ATP synthase assembly protein I